MYIPWPLKCLMTSGSINSMETTNPLFLWVPFLILFFHVFVKHKRDLRLKYVLIAFVFLSSNFYLSTYDDIVYNNVKLCNHLQFYSSDYISTCNELHETCLLSQFSILTISKLKVINNNRSFYCLILTLSGDISLNPGPVYNHHLPSLKEWHIFKMKGLHLLHLNANSLLPEINELRYIAKLSNTTVIGITESKLGNCILDSEIKIDNYQILHCDRNRKGGGVACYVRNDLSYTEKDFFPEKIENIFFENLLPKTKPISVRIIYRPPNQNNLLQTLNENFAKLDTLKKELYILSDFNKKLYQHQNHTGCKNNTLVSKAVSNDVKNYLQFCTMFGLSQIIKSPTRVTCSSTSLIDNILASLPDRIPQEGVNNNVGLSDTNSFIALGKLVELKLEVCTKKSNLVHLKVTSATK